jgi:O-methyltransferase
MARERVHLTGSQKTLLLALYLRYVDARSRSPILGDPFAGEILSKIDVNVRWLAPSGGDAPLVATRARQLDGWTRDFLAAHPDAVVLNLACGLDSRGLRIAPPETVDWIELDYPEVIDLRARLVPQRPGVRMIGASVTEDHWWSEVPRGRPLLMVAEGLLMYVAPPDVHALLDRIPAHAPQGELLFDVLQPWAVQVGRLVRMGMQWSVRDVSEIRERHPALRLRESVSVPALAGTYDLPPVRGAIYPAFLALPGMRNVMRLLRYEFSEGTPQSSEADTAGATTAAREAAARRRPRSR